jgi:hypothetical protein
LLLCEDSETNKTFAVGLTTFITESGVDWGAMTAAATFALIPVCVFFAFAQRYLVHRTTLGFCAVEQPEAVSQEGRYNGESGEKGGADRSTDAERHRETSDDLGGNGRSCEQGRHRHAELGHFHDAGTPVPELVLSAVEKDRRKQ